MKNESYEVLFETAINESLLNKETIEINLDKWENSENNILYITGLSGGGKSTLAKEYSEKYNVPFFELDFITDVSYRGRDWGNKILNRYYNESSELNNFIRAFINDESFIISNTKDFNRCFGVAKQFCKKAERELKGKYIFEGVQIFVKNNNDFFLDDKKSMILIGTGLITADIRAIKRTFKKNIPIKKKMKMLFYRIGDILNKKSPNNRQSLEYDEFRKIVTDYKENI